MWLQLLPPRDRVDRVYFSLNLDVLVTCFDEKNEVFR